MWTITVIFLPLFVSFVYSQTCSGGAGQTQQAQGYTPTGALVCTNCVKGRAENNHQAGVKRDCLSCGGSTCSQNSDCGGVIQHWNTCSDMNSQCSNGFCMYSTGACPSGWTSNGGSRYTLRCCPTSSGVITGFVGGHNADNSGCVCSSGYFWLQAALACVICPTGSSSSTIGATSCTCTINGYSWDSITGTCFLNPLFTPTSSITPTPTISITASISRSPSLTPTISPSASPTYPCAAGYFLSVGGCTPCPPGTYSLAFSAVCSLCPEGTYGSRAGLTTSDCSGVCVSCPAGSTVKETTSLSCISTDTRAVPSTLGLQFWPAAHPLNTQKIDLIVAPLAQCQLLTSSTACATAATIVGIDSVMRYVVGTATEYNMEAAETLTCI